ncbi:hypothetical protein KCP74_03940 [Salmonella enterica subsp. enterica]|nr:hypothetical protein KCP74_03940 [Salmonella enterica subsp. enterica]
MTAAIRSPGSRSSPDAIRCSCNSDGTVPFTDLVDQAPQQGLTEPDPRVDLPKRCHA